MNMSRLCEVCHRYPATKRITVHLGVHVVGFLWVCRANCGISSPSHSLKDRIAEHPLMQKKEPSSDGSEPNHDRSDTPHVVEEVTKEL